MKPLAIDLFCGLGGWTEGLQAAGWDVIGFDIERHVYGDHQYPAQLVLQDILTLHGSQFRDAGLIVASPPCQEYSYMAMPWKRAKQIERALNASKFDQVVADRTFPDGYKGSRNIGELNALFDACFRIQREASEAKGEHVPLVVENVCGAQKWVGPARWRHGSYYLWGDVPALMPIVRKQAKVPGQDWNNYSKSGEVSPHWNISATKVPTVGGGRRPDKGSGARFTTDVDGRKNTGGSWFNVAHNTESGKGRNPDGRKLRDADGYERTHPNAFGWKSPRTSSGATTKRKAASAMIAKIPFDLARHVGAVYA